MTRWLRSAALGLGFLLLLAGLLVGRAWSAGRQALERSDAHFNRGEVALALDSAREAASWYVPLAPHVRQAHARLVAIAVGAEAHGEPQLAQRAWSAIRGMQVETAHPWPFEPASRQALRTQAEQSLVRLLSQTRQAGGEAASSAATPERLRQAHARAHVPELRVTLSHGLGLVLLMLAMALGCVGGPLPRTLVWSSGALGLAFWVLAALGT